MSLVPEILETVTLNKVRLELEEEMERRLKKRPELSSSEVLQIPSQKALLKAAASREHRAGRTIFRSCIFMQKTPVHLLRFRTA